jgi:hypothetical protein
MGARILSDDPDMPVNVSDWAQAWLDSDGYALARLHAEAERG